MGQLSKFLLIQAKVGNNTFFDLSNKKKKKIERIERFTSRSYVKKYVQ